MDRIPMTFLYSVHQPGEAKAWVESLEDEDVRELAKAEYYYFRGKPERAEKLAEPYLDHARFDLKITAHLIYAYANGLLGHVHKAHYSLEKMKTIFGKVLERYSDEEIKGINLLLSVTSRMFFRYPAPELNDLKEYISYMPEGFQMHACYLFARQAYQEEDYGKSLGIAETAFAMQKDIRLVPAIYLKLIVAADLMALKRPEQAKKEFMQAWKLAKPDGILEPFGEHHSLLHGLVETCLKTEEYDAYKKISGIANNFNNGWRRFNKMSAGEDMTEYLTTTEFSVAMLANRRWTNAEIAGYMHLSEHTVKRYISDVYQKLGISSRKELRTFMSQ